MKQILLLALLVLLPGTVSAAWTPVQSKQSTALGADPQTLAFTSNVTNGHLIVVFHEWGTGSGTLTISKSSGTATIGTCTTTKNLNDATNGQSAGVGWCLVTGTGSLTMQATDSIPSGNFCAMVITEWSGNSATPHDVVGGQLTSGTTPSTGNITTTANGDLVIAAFSNDGGSGALTGPGSGYTQLLTPPAANMFYVEYQIQAASGTIAATATDSVNQSVLALIDSFKVSGGAAACVPTRTLLGVGC